MNCEFWIGHKLQACDSGGKRSTGKYKGKVPSPVIIKIDE